MKKINFIKNHFFYNSIFVIIIIIFLSISHAEEKNLISEIYPFNEDGTINAVVEIPAGTLEKWEISKDGNQIIQKIENNKIRTINYLAYPFNYGFIPQTFLPVEEGGDGDQLDIIIIGPNVERGLVSYFEKKTIHQELIQQEIALNEKLQDLKHKIKLITNNDLDYLDMLYREKLRYGTKDEILIKLK